MNLVVVSNVQQRLREICSLLEVSGNTMEVIPIEGGLERLADIPVHQDPKVMILDCGGVNAKELERMEYVHQLYPELACIVVTDVAAPEFLISAMRAGVREVLPLPVTGPALATAIGRVVKKGNGHQRRHGRILSFVSCKGGGGTSFLAANLAYAMSEQGQKVLLLDLNLQFGDAALFVSDQKVAMNVADVAEEIERVDASFLASCVSNITPNFAVLAAPEDPARARVVKPEHVDTLLRLARHQYDFIVIDAGRGLDMVTVRALDHTDMIYAVLQLTLPFVRDCKRLMDAFHTLDYSRNKIRIVVNRYQKGGDIDLADVKRAVGHEVAHVVPNLFAEVASSVNQGVPVLKLAPNCSVSKALLEIVATQMNVSVKSGEGWLSRVLNRG
ncbi:MAG TPA: AAA family ATPase [Azospira sp.]|nr:AAA family ATPase [Azospira sp.]